MTDVKATVEFAENNLTAYIPGIDGVIGIGDTLEETRKSLQESLAYRIQDCKEYGMEVPEVLTGEYRIVYSFDLRTFLQVFSGVIGKSGLERLTGINQKQLFHYASGKSKPREATIRKVETSIHRFADVLASVQFV